MGERGNAHTVSVGRRESRDHLRDLRVCAVYCRKDRIGSTSLWYALLFEMVEQLKYLGTTETNQNSIR